MDDIRADLDSLNPAVDWGSGDRRDFLRAALGTGFAAAVMPVMAQTMTRTDTDGLLAGEVTIRSGDLDMRAYRAQPEGKSQLPVVLVVSEIFGVHEHIADIARRFAKLGYLAIAPELFQRQGDPRQYESIPELISKVVSKVPDEQVMRDLDACVAWAGSHQGDTQQIGVTGFCWGGRITWLYAAHNPRVKAAVAWYGKVVQDKTPLQPQNPIDMAASLRVPVLGLYGGKDAGIPLEGVDRMRDALSRGKSGSEIVVYPDAGHAFHADYRPSYRETEARDGWRRCVDWMRRHGVSA